MRRDRKRRNRNVPRSSGVSILLRPDGLPSIEHKSQLMALAREHGQTHVCGHSDVENLEALIREVLWHNTCCDECFVRAVEALEPGAKAPPEDCHDLGLVSTAELATAMAACDGASDEHSEEQLAELAYSVYQWMQQVRTGQRLLTAVLAGEVTFVVDEEGDPLFQRTDLARVFEGVENADRFLDDRGGVR